MAKKFKIFLAVLRFPDFRLTGIHCVMWCVHFSFLCLSSLLIEKSKKPTLRNEMSASAQ